MIIFLQLLICHKLINHNFRNFFRIFSAYFLWEIKILKKKKKRSQDHLYFISVLNSLSIFELLPVNTRNEMMIISCPWFDIWCAFSFRFSQILFWEEFVYLAVPSTELLLLVKGHTMSNVVYNFRHGWGVFHSEEAHLHFRKCFCIFK